ncbi:MAG: FprA family A-type flavoprotein [Bacteroidales bacterium]|jgi:flavorubredoxin|nr:FprA family A-type flavoprotein [Bacteroidales bacterium]
MYNKRPIAKDIYYVGVNDRQKSLFENYIPLPAGVSYNSYLIADEKTALVDTVDVSFADVYFAKLEAVLNGRPVDYLIVNHMEPDHAGAIGLLKQKYPQITIVGNAKTFDMLKGYFHIDTQLHEVKEGDTLCLGKRKLTFYMAPMVHWPEVMVACENTDKILFSADAFGTFGTLDGDYLDENLNTDKYWDEMRRYYACIVGKFGVPAQNAIKKILTLNAKTICPTHGPVWQKDIQKAIANYDTWSKYEARQGVVIAYGSMYGNTQQLAEAVAEGVVSQGIKDVVIHNVSKTDTSFILSDIFEYKGVIIGSPTYMMGVYPMIEKLLSYIEHRGVKNRYYSCFGSFTWAGAAVKTLTAFSQTMNWELVGNPVENKQAVFAPTYSEAFALGVAMAERLKTEK